MLVFAADDSAGASAVLFEQESDSAVFSGALIMCIKGSGVSSSMGRTIIRGAFPFDERVLDQHVSGYSLHSPFLFKGTNNGTGCSTSRPISLQI